LIIQIRRLFIISIIKLLPYSPLIFFLERLVDKATIPLLLLPFLFSCISKSPLVNTETAKKHDHQIYEYHQRADHLTDEQKTAMMNYEPFLGMTIDEARIAMR